MRPLAITTFLVLGGCHFPSILALAGSGPTMPVGDALAQDSGFAVQTVLGVDNVAVHTHFRRAGETQELALGLGGFHVGAVGKNLVGYTRFAVNLIEWDRVGMDDGAGILGPTLEAGIGTPVGLCVSVAAARDLRFNDPDDTFVGVTVNLCTAIPGFRIK